MKRRIRIIVAILVLITLLMAGCSSTEQDLAQPKSEETKITEVQTATTNVEEKAVKQVSTTSQTVESTSTQPPSQTNPTPSTSSSNPEPEKPDTLSTVATIVVAGSVASSQANLPSESTTTTQPVIGQSVTESLVWIPVNGGTKYHSKASCSNMKDPIQVTLSEAVSKGFEPCKRCH